METKEAIEILKVVCANFNGNYNDHVKIQTALSVIINNLKEDAPGTPNP